MAKVTLSTQAQAEGSPYFFKFFTLTDLGGTVVARSQVGGTVLEFRAANNAALLAKLSSYESYRSDNGKTTH